MLNELISIIGSYQLNWSWPVIPMEINAVVILVASFGLLVAAEKIFPRSLIPKSSLWQSFRANLNLFLFNSLIMSMLSASSLWSMAKQHYSFGLLSYVQSPVLRAVIALLSLDLMLYIWHRACHRFDSLWMFHKVHHNDPYLNVTTGFRVHITEMFTTYILKAIMIISMGIDGAVVLIHEVATTLFVMFHHANHSFKGERWLGYLITTPKLHLSHHSLERFEHDSNYGAVLSVWDRLFGTLNEKDPAGVGIKGYSPMDFVGLIKFGFVKKLQPATASLPANMEAMIAEAAYYKAEKRNFKPGREWEDWLEAKQEILWMIYRNLNFR